MDDRGGYGNLFVELESGVLKPLALVVITLNACSQKREVYL